MSENFCVIKRNGIKEEVSFDKVTRRLKKLCHNLSSKVNPMNSMQPLKPIRKFLENLPII